MGRKEKRLRYSVDGSKDLSIKEKYINCSITVAIFCSIASVFSVGQGCCCCCCCCVPSVLPSIAAITLVLLLLCSSFPIAAAAVSLPACHSEHSGAAGAGAGLAGLAGT